MKGWGGWDSVLLVLLLAPSVEAKGSWSVLSVCFGFFYSHWNGRVHVGYCALSVCFCVCWVYWLDLSYPRCDDLECSRAGISAQAMLAAMVPSLYFCLPNTSLRCMHLFCIQVSHNGCRFVWAYSFAIRQVTWKDGFTMPRSFAASHQQSQMLHRFGKCLSLIAFKWNQARWHSWRFRGVCLGTSLRFAASSGGEVGVADKGYAWLCIMQAMLKVHASAIFSPLPRHQLMHMQSFINQLLHFLLFLTLGPAARAISCNILSSWQHWQRPDRCSMLREAWGIYNVRSSGGRDCSCVCFPVGWIT